MKVPTVSVLLPVYNGEKHLKEAIESILNQTFNDFEFLIINDGSTDKSDEIIVSYKDNRIRYIKNEKNIGLIASLNNGIRLSKGNYIARMDADDVSCSDRFYEQVKFLETHPEVGMCGSDFEKFGENSSGVTIKCISDFLLIKASFLFNCPMAHPSVMLRASVIMENSLFYDPYFVSAEDYELWWRLSFKTQITNINKVLLRYRSHDLQVSEKDKFRQQLQSDKIREKILEYYKLKFNQEQLLIHNAFCNLDYFKSVSSFVKTEKWLKYLLNENRTMQFLPGRSLSEIIHLKWMSHVYNSSIGISGALLFLISPLTWLRGLDLINILKTSIKCLMKRN